jgi:hypothetical protein
MNEQVVFFAAIEACLNLERLGTALENPDHRPSIGPALSGLHY